MITFIFAQISLMHNKVTIENILKCRNRLHALLPLVAHLLSA